MASQAQRDAAIALKETFSKAADDITSKTADFHDLTADTSVDGAHAMQNTDSDLGTKYNGMGNDRPQVGTRNPEEGGAPSGGKTPTNNGGPVTDSFGGKNTGGQDGGSPAVNRGGSSGCNQVGEPVDVISGQFVTAGIDVQLPGLLPLVLRRAYTTAFPGGRLFGPGWSSTLDIRVLVGDDGITLFDDDCRILSFPVPSQPGEVVHSAAGRTLTLAWDRTTDTIRVEERSAGWRYEFASVAGSPDRHDTVLRPLTAIADRNGNRITILRDEDLPVEVQHNGGYRVAVETVYTPAGFRVEGLRLLETAANSEGTVLLRYQYDPRGRLIGVVDSSGVPFYYDWDAQDRIIAWVDRSGFEFTYEYDLAGRVVRTSGQDGYGSGAFAYDPKNRVTVYTDSLGQSTSFHYDEQHRVTKLVDALGAESTAEYDQDGEIASSVDALGRATRYQRDPAGQLVRIERPDGSATDIEYGPHFRPTRLTRPDGATWSYEYDDLGNLLAEIDPCGATTRYERSPHGAACAIIDAAGARTVLESNAAGLLVASTDPLGNRTLMRRDAFGRVSESTDPLGATTQYGWSVEGLPLWRVLPDGYRQERRYNPQGDLIEESDPLSAVTRFERGPFSVPTARIAADGTRLEFAYDTELRLTTVTNPLGQTWRYTYDAMGNLASETDFDGRAASYERDAFGQLIGRVNAAGERAEFLWDDLGRIAAQRASDGHEVTFSYDGADRLTRASNGEAVVDLTYDAVGRVLSESINDLAIANSYDLLGRRVARRTSSGAATSWAHDANHRVTEMTSAGTHIAVGYDGAGRESYRWIGESTAITSTWDSVGRRSSTQLVSVEGSSEARSSRLLREQAFTYRNDGIPESVHDTVAGDRAYELDTRGRVTAVRAADWSEQYAYDAAGRLLDVTVPSTSEGSDDSGARVLQGALLRQAGRTSYEHDAQGRLTRITRRTLSGQSRAWAFAYDCFDRLTEASTPEGQRWRYRYDPLGRRYLKQRLDNDGEVAEEIRFIWDDQSLAEQIRTQANNDTVTATTWEYNSDGYTAAAQTERSYLASAPQDVVDEKFYAIISDLAGAPIALVTASGETIWRQATSLWGAVVTEGQSGGHGDCPLRFPGQYHDLETGLHYNLHRYYDPRTVRFTTPDPLGLAPAPDNYGYVGNPLDEIDPLGLAAKRKGSSNASDPTPAPTPEPVKRAATQPIPAPDTLPGFPDAKRVRPKTPVQGGGGMRKRWEDKKNIYEWDSQHGEVEMYDKRGKHLGSFDAETGKPITDKDGNIKGAVSGRTCSR
jgi:RHS repeat-associated protein